MVWMPALSPLLFTALCSSCTVAPARIAVALGTSSQLRALPPFKALQWSFWVSAEAFYTSFKLCSCIVLAAGAPRSCLAVYIWVSEFLEALGRHSAECVPGHSTALCAKTDKDKLDFSIPFHYGNSPPHNNVMSTALSRTSQFFPLSFVLCTVSVPYIWDMSLEYIVDVSCDKSWYWGSA